MNSTITEMKYTLEGINSRITEEEERISDLEDRMVEFTAAEQNKEKEVCAWKIIRNVVVIRQRYVQKRNTKIL